MSQEDIKQELIKLVEPCKDLCLECGAPCCKGCTALENGLCTKRNVYCLMYYCDKMEKQFPEIVNKIKQISKEMFPEAAKRGIEIDLKWVEKAQED